ncbi:MAG: hypothetical protein SOZ22_01070, partial [Ezakiella sp.]|nr:hypothetical protein [Ezakiella sp.]
HDDVLISRVLRLLRAAVHGKPFRLRQNDVVLEIRVYVGLYIFGVSPGSVLSSTFFDLFTLLF